MKRAAILKAFPFDDKWMIGISQPAIPQNNMHEYLLFRTEESNPLFTAQLESLPVYATSEGIIDIKEKYGVYV